MRPGGGKQKGASFEREICKRLSLWVTAGKREDVFWRSAMSGGRATVARQRGRDITQCGDIASVHPAGHEFLDTWYVECKFYKSLALDSFLIMSTGPLAKFWKTACKEALHYRRQPMLIAKQNGWPILVITKFGCTTTWTTPYVTTRALDITLFQQMTESPYEC